MTPARRSNRRSAASRPRACSCRSAKPPPPRSSGTPSPLTPHARSAPCRGHGISAVGISARWTHGASTASSPAQKGPHGPARHGADGPFRTRMETRNPSRLLLLFQTSRATRQPQGAGLFTSPVNTSHRGAARKPVHAVRRGGLDALCRKQWALTCMVVRTGALALDLPLFAPTHYAWGVTSIMLPPGWTAVSSSRWRPTNAASYSRGDKIIRAAWSASGTGLGGLGRRAGGLRSGARFARLRRLQRVAIIWKRHFPHIIAPLTLSRDGIIPDVS